MKTPERLPAVQPAPYCVGKGDFNLDNVADLLDIDLLGLTIAAGSNDAWFDVNSDRLVNQDDLNLFLSGNFITDGSKLNGDADFDGTVAFADFLALSANFGKTAGSVTQIPTPSTSLLAAFGAVGLLGLRRRR